MNRTLTTTALLALCCTTCATTGSAPTDARHWEAQRAVEEGSRLKAEGKHSEALLRFERALGIQTELLGEHHPEVIPWLRTIALLRADQGDYASATALHEQVLAIQEATLGKHDPEVASSLHRLAGLKARQGLYEQAEPLLMRAVAIRETFLGQHHPDLADSYEALANLYSDQGQHGRAEPLHLRALAIRETFLGQHHPDLADSYEALANLYMEKRLHDQAQPLYERALAIRESVLGEDRLAMATTLQGVANLYMEQGLHERAESFYQRALAIREASLGRNHPDVAASLHSLSSLYLERGYPERARPPGERALKIRETTLGESHPDVARTLHHLALLSLAEQRLDEALPLLTRAFTLSEEHLRQESFGLSETRLASVLYRLRADEERLYSLACEYPDDDRARRLSLSAALLRKGRSIEELANISRIIYHGLGRADRETFERLRVLRTERATLAFAGRGSLSTARYQQRLEELAHQGDILEAQLARRSEPLRALHSLPPPAEIVERVAAAIPTNGALVEFIAYQDSPLVPGSATPPSPRERQLRYLALLLFSDGRTGAIDLGPAGPVDDAIRHFHDALARRLVSYRSSARALYSLVFLPLVPHLGNVRHLFLAPDGQLSLVPFAALHDGTRFLVDALEITYLTSGKDLLPRSVGLPPANSVVVLADPDFESPAATSSRAPGASPALALRSAPLERLFSKLRSRLPGTRKEAKAIKRMFPHAQLFLDREATKEALLTLSPPGVLHIATHGFFLQDPTTSEGSRAVKQFELFSPPIASPDPLLRSGLMLAGAFSPPSQHDSRLSGDSLVTALELAGLNLWGTQLVVLSACDTGLGDIRIGQGVYGLRRSLMVAGAETLVTSLWKVNDDATRRLMAAYYRNLLAGQGRSAALRGAMRALRRQREHPHFWAPFIAIGQASPPQGLGTHTASSSTIR